MMLGGITGSSESIMEKCKTSVCRSGSLQNSAYCFKHHVEAKAVGKDLVGIVNDTLTPRARCPISMVGFLIYHAAGASRLTVCRTVSSKRFTYQRVGQLLRSEVVARLASDWEPEALGDWIARTIATDMDDHHLASRVRGLYKVTAFGKDRKGRFERSKHIKVSGINGTL